MSTKVIKLNGGTPHASAATPEPRESFALHCRQSYLPHDLMAVLRRLRQSGRTGTLRISMHCGGVAGVEFCEEHVIHSDASDAPSDSHS